VTAAIGALKGSLHGGANEAVMRDMIEIGTGDKAAQWLQGKLSRRNKIMGFGHRVYKNGDSRARSMPWSVSRPPGMGSAGSTYTKYWRTGWRLLPE
jgi:2-methylcitrate synthase